MEGETIGIIAGSIGAVAMAVAGVFAKTRKNGKAQQPASPSPAEPPPTKSEVEVLKTQVEHIEKDMSQFRDDTRDDFKGLHKKIDKLDSKISMALDLTPPPRPDE